ncbi:MAG: TonB-dependent receptor domain-containing protein [Candidatus Zixiibacteriota bacterium]
MKIFAVLFSILLLLNLPSVAGSLSGRDFDWETGNLIRDVNIKIIGINQVTATDKHGEYSIRNLENGSYYLIATHIAYDASDTIAIIVTGAERLDFKLKPLPWILNDVVVTGTRSPYLLKDVPVQTEVITKKDFESTNATSVDEALASSIGITINEDLSGQGATIRGIEGDRVLILVDGERAVGRVRGTIDLSQYSLNNVEKIEIVKGAGSTLYGSDAMGGVINIITKKPSNDINKVDAYIDYGSNFSYNPSIDLEYGNQMTGLVMGGKLFSTKGFDLDKSTPHTNGQEEINRWNLTGKLYHQLTNKWNVTGSGRFMKETRAWVESEIFPTFVLAFDDEEINKRFEGATVFNYLSGDSYSMKFRLYGTYYNHNWNKFSENTGEWVDTSHTEDIFYELSYTSNYAIGQRHMATYGFDYNYQDLSSTELVDKAKADKSIAGYFQYEYSPIKTFNFVTGIRYENHSSFGGHINPSINIMYMPSNQIKFRGFVGRGFRAPSIKQQYFIFDHTAAGYIVFGGSVPLPGGLNPDAVEFRKLKQEHSINSSVSVELSYGTVGMHRLTYFYNHLEDLIDFTLLGFTPTYWRGFYIYQNIETAITQGIEWESRIRLSSSINFSFSYDYLYTRNLTLQEKLINRPDHTVKFVLTANSNRWHIGGSIWGDYQSKKLWVPRSNTGGNEGAPDYASSRTRINMRLFKKFHNGVEAFVNLNNLLNETNLTYGYWPGFEIFAGFKYSFNFNQ